jgi:hypothetical protein
LVCFPGDKGTTDLQVAGARDHRLPTLSWPCRHNGLQYIRLRFSWTHGLAYVLWYAYGNSRCVLQCLLAGLVARSGTQNRLKIVRILLLRLWLRLRPFTFVIVRRGRHLLLKRILLLKNLSLSGGGRYTGWRSR